MNDAPLPNPFRQGLDPEPVPAPAAPRPPSAGLWLIYLYLRPRRFFQHFVVGHVAALTALCAWMYGMAGVIDRLATAQVQGRPVPIPDTWAAHWGMIMGAGVLGGVLYYGIGGWWYRVRVRWSGFPEPDPVLARRVYLYSSMVMVIPLLIAEILETGAYASPRATAGAPGTLYHAVLIIFPFWSILTSFIGVRTVFPASLWKSSLWFLGLPVAVYGLALVVVAGAAIMHTMGPPDVKRPAQHVTVTWAFSYPGNWHLDSTSGGYDPDGHVMVEAPQDAAVILMLYPSQEGVAEELAQTTQGLEDEGWLEAARADEATWGAHRGSARTLRRTVAGSLYEYRVFAAHVRGGLILETHEVLPVSEAETLQPGFDQVRGSLVVRP